MWKECKIYLINTNKEPDFGDLCKSVRYPGKLLILGQFENSYFNECMQFNLIITSDEEIKEGDWIYNTLHINESIHIIEDLDDIEYHTKRTQYKKIISSTDPNITANSYLALNTCRNLLPQPTKKWIEYFIKEYNDGNIIKECLVEYEIKEVKIYDNPGGHPGGHWEEECILKLSNNTISIKSIEPVLYTEEEVKIISHNSYNYGFKGGLYEYSGMQSKEHSCNSFDEWFEQNKKK